MVLVVLAPVGVAGAERLPEDVERDMNETWSARPAAASCAMSDPIVATPDTVSAVSVARATSLWLSPPNGPWMTMTGATFIWMSVTAAVIMRRDRVVFDRREPIEQRLLDPAHLLLARRERIDVRAPGGRRVASVEGVEVVHGLIAKRLKARERPRGARERGPERQRRNDRQGLPPEREPFRRRRGSDGERLRLDRAEARRELLGEHRQEHLVRLGRPEQAEHRGLPSGAPACSSSCARRRFGRGRSAATTPEALPP